MPKQKHTKESIVQTLKNISSQVGRSALSKRDVQQHMPLSAVNYHYGNLGTALKAAGLCLPERDSASVGERTRLSDEELFESVLAVEQFLVTEACSLPYGGGIALRQ